MILKEKDKKIPACGKDVFQLKKLADEIRIVKTDSCMYIKILNDETEPKISNHTVVIKKIQQLIGNVQKCDEASLEKAKICYYVLLDELKAKKL